MKNISVGLEVLLFLKIKYISNFYFKNLNDEELAKKTVTLRLYLSCNGILQWYLAIVLQWYLAFRIRIYFLNGQYIHKSKVITSLFTKLCFKN